MAVLQVENYELAKFVNDNSNFEVVHNFMAELMTVIFNAPPNEHKEKYVHSFLDQLFADVDFKKSFTKKMILLHCEVLLPENLLQLHSWFIKQCCNIENIVLISILNIGVRDWYSKYINLIGTPGLTIIEAPWLYVTPWNRIQQTIPPLDKTSISKKLKYYFNFWGGTYPTLERDVLAAVWSNTPNGFVDYGQYGSTQQELDDYLEQLTYFGNRELVDQLLNIKQHTEKFTGSASTDLIGYYNCGIQYEYDSKSALIPIRETSNNVVYSTITEKTIRAFIHMQIPLPISGVGTVDALKQLGFKFCDIVDYDSFQYEKIFLKRVGLIKDEILRIQQTYTLKQLEEYILDHKEIFYDNYNLIQQGTLAEQSAKVVIAELKK